MKKQAWIVGVVLAAALSGGALAQTVRAPSGSVQTPNLTVAPASAVDVAALQARLAQLEAAHNTTRTELAQTRLQLQATQTRLGALVDGVHRYALCEKQRATLSAGAGISGAVGPLAPGCGTSWDNLNHLSNTQ